jgi:hypothetical protein
MAGGGLRQVRQLTFDPYHGDRALEEQAYLGVELRDRIDPALRRLKMGWACAHKTVAGESIRWAAGSEAQVGANSAHAFAQGAGDLESVDVSGVVVGEPDGVRAYAECVSARAGPLAKNRTGLAINRREGNLRH